MWLWLAYSSQGTHFLTVMLPYQYCFVRCTLNIVCNAEIPKSVLLDPEVAALVGPIEEPASESVEEPDNESQVDELDGL